MYIISRQAGGREAGSEVEESKLMLEPNDETVSVLVAASCDGRDVPQKLGPFIRVLTTHTRPRSRRCWRRTQGTLEQL